MEEVKIFDTKKAAEYKGITLSRFRRLVTNGDGPDADLIGKSYVFTREALDAWKAPASTERVDNPKSITFSVEERMHETLKAISVSHNTTVAHILRTILKANIALDPIDEPEEQPAARMSDAKATRDDKVREFVKEHAPDVPVPDEEPLRPDEDNPLA